MEKPGCTGGATRRVWLINQESGVAAMRREGENGRRVRVSCGEEGILRSVTVGRLETAAEEERRGSLEGDGRQDKLKKVEIEERKWDGGSWRQTALVKVCRLKERDVYSYG